MTDMNTVIANNINRYLEMNHKKQVELAEHLNLSRQIVNKMLNGTRTINAVELRQIAEARQSIQDIDLLINLILFHDTVRENGMAMREEWTEF